MSAVRKSTPRLRSLPALLVALALVLAGGRVAAGPPNSVQLSDSGSETQLSDIEERAVAFCVSFTTVVQKHAGECATMGTELEALVEKNEQFIAAIASMKSGPVQERCVFELEKATDPLLDCSDAPEIGDALARLSAAGAVDTGGPDGQATSEMEEYVARTAAYCEALATSLESIPEAERSDCSRVSARIDAIRGQYGNVLSEPAPREAMEPAQRQAFSTAAARCLEGLLVVHTCADDPAVKGAFQP